MSDYDNNYMPGIPESDGFASADDGSDLAYLAGVADAQPVDFDNATPYYAEEFTQLSGGLQLPTTPDEFLAASGTLENVRQVVAGSPGAAQFFNEQARHGVDIVVNRVEALAERMGGNVIDRPAAYAHASTLYDAAIRAGDTPDAAQEWALTQAAKAATGQRGYKDIADEWTKRTFGTETRSQPKRGV